MIGETGPAVDAAWVRVSLRSSVKEGEGRFPSETEE